MGEVYFMKNAKQSLIISQIEREKKTNECLTKAPMPSGKIAATIIINSSDSGTRRKLVPDIFKN